MSSFQTPAITAPKTATAVTQLSQVNDVGPELGMYLTSDAVKDMLGFADNDVQLFTPTVQVLHIKTIPQAKSVSETPAPEKRWKIVISDGIYFMSGILASQLNRMADSGEIKKHAIIKLKQFTLSTMHTSSGKQRIFVLLDAEHQRDMDKRLGDPVDVSTMREM